MLGLIGAVALVASLAATVGNARPTAAKHSTAIAAPKVPNAAAIKKKYGGQKITFVGDSVGDGNKRDTALAKRFSKDTGIKVSVVPHPAASDQSYAQLVRAFSQKSSSIDVAMIDVVWPGAFAPYLVNLKPKLGKQAKLHAQGIIQNDTIGGKLVAMPWFGDYGILYYRTDLLKKYGYKAPPKTWADLFKMAKKIQDGEQKTNPNFAGFVFQGNAYEGLPATRSSGSRRGWRPLRRRRQGVDQQHQGRDDPGRNAQPDRQDHASRRDLLPGGPDRARVDAGDAAFARNWPYQYGIGAGAASKVKGKFSVTTLPHGAKGGPVGTVGGWQLAVSKYSKHKDAAIEFVRYMTSPAVEKFDALTNSNVPTILSVAKDKAVRAKNPYLKPAIASVPRVTRPAKFFKTHYNEASKIIAQGITRSSTARPPRACCRRCSRS